MTSAAVVKVSDPPASFAWVAQGGPPKAAMLARAINKRQRALDEGQEWGSDVKPPALKLKRRAALAGEAQAASALRVRESALFRPIRSVGSVIDNLPFAPSTLSTADFLVASIGKSFQVFECEHLRWAFLSPRMSEKIRGLASVDEVVLTSLKSDIVAWYKLTELGRFRGHRGPATVMCAIGSTYLISAAGSEVLVWNMQELGFDKANAETAATDAAEAKANDEGTSSRKTTKVIEPSARLVSDDPDFGDCTAIVHPQTYLHKVLIGSSAGNLALWNVKTQTCLHTFKALAAGGRPNSSIICLCTAPNVLDTVAVGFASGRICVLNVREDRILMEFQQAQGRVTALSFRTGSGAPAQLVSGAPNGAFVVWDLEKRRAHHVFDKAHHGPLTAAHFLPGQPLLVTSGVDNALRMWIFDTPDGLPRLLRERVGCPGQSRALRFYGPGDREVVAAGVAQEGGFVAKVSLIQSQQNIEYAQTAFNKLPAGITGPSVHGRLRPVIDMAVCEARHFDWPALVTAHEGTDAAFVWSAANKALVPHVMRPPDEAECAPVTSVAISACGNYCVVGLDNGALHRFNLQSQLHRGSFPKEPDVPVAVGSEELGAPAKKKVPGKASIKERRPRAHEGRVCGVAMTVSGQVISASSHPRDCRLHLWKLATHEALGVIDLAVRRLGSPSCIRLRQHGSLVATALDDGGLLVADIQGRAVVRSFACGAPASDIAFSADGRWLAAALRGGGLRVFDLPAARCIDSFAFAKPALSVCFSPSTAFLLTTHAKGNAIQVWANKFLFDPTLSAPLLRPEPTEPIYVDEPGADPDEDDDDEEEGAADEERKDAAREKAVVDATPLAKDLLTLSDVPPAKWLATLHLDVVKERNKPTEAPKPLPSAPFFLPTAHEGVTAVFADPFGAPEDAAALPERKPLGDEIEEDRAAEGEAGGSSGSRISRGKAALGLGSAFRNMLRKGKFEAALQHLKKQTPSGVHLALEELGPLSGGDLADLAAALAFFEHHLALAHFADEVQAFLSLFLQAHGEDLAGDDELRATCARLAQVQDNMWSSLDTQCQKARCFLGTLTHTQSQW